MREIKFTEAINEALHIAMEQDPHMLCYGLGVDDPKRIFGTTAGLKEKFPERVFDVPTAENGFTGIGAGAAIAGSRTVMVHQRVDFFFLAMDQVVNTLAKWHYMFGGKNSVPVTIRLIVGHGWGQGPTHSQNIHAWFAHVPGLKVVMPTTPEEAKGLMLSSLFDPDPVIFIEHRWLHNIKGKVPEGDVRWPIGKARVRKQGADITVVGTSYMTVEALHAAEELEKQGLSVEVIDLLTIQPIDWDVVYRSVRKTGRLLAVDTGPTTCSLAAEVMARVSETCFSSLKCAPERVAQPDCPAPTSRALTKVFFKRAEEIALKIGEMMGKSVDITSIVQARGDTPHDVPGDWFTGPF